MRDFSSSNTAHVGPLEGQALRMPEAQLITRKVSSEQTGGAYSLFEVAVESKGSSQPHIQHREDECFYVLEGEFEFLIEGATIEAGPGSLIYVPRGNLHAHRNVGEESAKMLVTQTPGGLYERFFEEVGEPKTDRPTLPVSEKPLDVEAVIAIAAQYGIEMIPPASAGELDGKDSR